MEIDTWNTPGEGYIDNRTLVVYPFAISGVTTSQCLTPILLLFSLERHRRDLTASWERGGIYASSSSSQQLYRAFHPHQPADKPLDLH